MKLYKFLIILTFLAIPFAFQSCSDSDIAGVDSWADPDYNTDPNNPPDVAMALLLPSAQGAVAYASGGDLGRYTSVWVQQHGGVDRQHAGIDQYRLTEADVNNVWRFSLYAGGMNALDTLISKGIDTGSPHFVGVGKIMMALNLGIITDLFGDIPYSDAFGGLDNFTPTYDTQEQIYASIDQLLSEAVTDMAAESSLFSPSADDLIYGGNLVKWTELAHTLRARYAIHLSARNGQSAYETALSHIDSGISSNDNDFTLDRFGTTVPQQNPWYQFFDQRDDIRMGAFFIDLMKSINDPRLPVFAGGTVDRGTEEEPDIDYYGSAAGVPVANSSPMGSYYASQTSPVPLVTYVETKFIEAEAAFMTGDLERAASAHNAAIIASLNRHGVFNQAYVDDQASETAASINLEKIMTHKYVALYTQPEVYVDWRRTGIPALQGAANTNGNIPVRFPYPQSERLYNGNNVPASQIPANLNEPLWWDM